MVKAMPSMQGVSWSLEEDAQLRSSFEEKLPIDSIAKSYQRSNGAIRSRLARLGLLNPNGSNKFSSNVEQSSESKNIPQGKKYELSNSAKSLNHESRLNILRVTIELDKIQRNIEDIRACLVLGKSMTRKSYTDFTKSIRQFDSVMLEEINNGLLTINNDDRIEFSEDIGDPLLDRLYTALNDLLRVCVYDSRDRDIFIQAFGLDGAEKPRPLSDLAIMLRLSRERVRQLRNRATLKLHNAARRQNNKCKEIRLILHAISQKTDWTNPDQTVQQIAEWFSPNISIVAELSTLCCLASGHLGKSREIAEAASKSALIQTRKQSTNLDESFDIWNDVAKKTIFPECLTKFEAPPPEFIDRKREPHDSTNSVFLSSKKLGRSVACESLLEHRVFTWLEKSDDVVWFQEQPIGIPYEWQGIQKRYFPDVVVLDQIGRCCIIEVKPVFNMYRHQVLEKSLACLNYAAERGMGYLIIDSNRRTISEYTTVAYEQKMAQEIEEVMDRDGHIEFYNVRKIVERSTNKLLPSLISMVINRDWCVTDAPGVRVSRLPKNKSFKQLLNRTSQW